MQSRFLTRKIQKSLSVLYGLVGAFLSFEICSDLWNEEAFGNDADFVCVLAPWGPYVGFLLLSSALSLLAGQLLVFFNRHLGLHLTRLSFFFAIVTNIAEFLVFKSGYVWGYVIDFTFHLFILILFYLPVIINPVYQENRVHAKLHS